MSKQIEALKLALEALELLHPLTCHDRITAIREALAEQPAQQEPVAWQRRLRLRETVGTFPQKSVWTDWFPCTEQQAREFAIAQDEQWEYEVRVLYTSPPASKPWVGLTDNEIALVNADYPHPQGFARAVEAKLREKNV